MAALRDDELAGLKSANAALRAERDAALAREAALSAELARRNSDYSEALEQQAATAEILQVINASPGDLTLVFNAILEKAHTLCGVAIGALEVWDGKRIRALATRGLPASFEEVLRRGVEPGPDHPHWRLVDGASFFHFPDQAVLEGQPTARKAVELAGLHTVLGVPLRKDGTLLGRIVTARAEVRPFTDKEIALLQNFAAQAVIAIENARLLGETREALEQQTATAEVLQVINASPGNLEPVFEVILEKAHTLCGAAKGAFVTFDGQHFQVAATRGLSDAYTTILQSSYPDLKAGYRVGEQSPREQLLNGADLIHLTGSAVAVGPVGRAAAELEKIRALLFLPLRRDGALLGYITAYGMEESTFCDKQIALLKNFAAQAVIAMENARLITETREALEQQTATAEVLRVINASPGDLAPVFDAILEKAHALCGARDGALVVRDGDNLRAVATHGSSEQMAAMLSQPFPPYPGGAQERLLQGERLIHIPDQAAREQTNPRERASVLGGTRTLLFIPLRNDGTLLGYITAARREVRPFSEKEITLLENFAAQAVIAMENARLITETREALEQQTATAEVLQVINSSPGDLRPVFDAMLERAMALCEADYGHVYKFEDGQFSPAAIKGDPGFMSYRRQRGPLRPQGDGTSALERLIAGESVVWAADVHEEQAYRTNARFRELADSAGIRSMATIALRKEDSLRGAIIVYRRQVRPFSQKQIALLRNFAEQAVIAMENARLITETREALEQQTATAEVLQVINSSPGNVTPVFEAMLEKAIRLCGGVQGALWTLDGERVKLAASRNPPEFAARLREHAATGVPEAVQQTMRSRLLHIPDFLEHELYLAGDPIVRAAVELGGFRSWVGVALVKDDAPVGAFVVGRRERRPFTEKQIALLQNFAAQAVIAMENARLITETREALEQQTATAEVLQVINSSPGDLEPVFETLLDRAMRLCGANFGEFHVFDGERLRLAAFNGVPGALAEFRRNSATIPTPGPTTLRMRDGTNVIHTADLMAEDAYREGNPHRRALVDLGGARTVLAVALRKDDKLLGAINIYRQEVKPFSDRQVALLQSFAAQAIIAMENARLLTETREALEQQTATAEVLQVINASPGNLEPVFDAILDKALHLCESPFGLLATYDGEFFHTAAQQGLTQGFADLIREPFRPHPGLHNERLVRGEQLVHISDITGEEAYRSNPTHRALADQSGARTAVWIALRRDDTLLGVINIYRQEVRAFSDRQIELLRGFAAQAVIAIDNARLLRELRQRTEELARRNSEYGERIEQQSATIDVLKAMSASSGDAQPVFQAIVERARAFCNADNANLALVDGGVLHPQATTITDSENAIYMAQFPRPVDTTSLFGRAILARDVVQTPDVRADAEHFARAGALSGETPVRALVAVPLLRVGVPIGAIVLARNTPGEFSATQVELLRTFAEQAVIAISSAETYRELQERTAALAQRNSEYGERIEQQSATIDVLKVMSASPDDTQPVFSQIVRRARELCNGWVASLFEFDGELVHVRAHAGDLPAAELAAYLTLFPLQPTRGSITCRAILDRQIIHIRDMDAETVMPAVRSLPHKSQLTIPLLRDNVAIGAITLAALEPGGFSDSQVALLQTFAEQAVIAVTSVANFRALRQRTAELTRSVAELQALEEVLRAVNSSLELETVLSTIISRAVQLSEADEGTIYEFDDAAEVFVPKAAFGMSTERVEWLRDRRVRLGETHLGRAAVLRAPVHIEDVQQEPTLADAGMLRGIHAVLAVPLLRDEKVVGGLVIRRRTVGGFAPTIPTLLQTFAGQAVLAIENARLFQEARQARVEAETTLADLRRAQDRLVQSEKMASLGQLTAGIAHEIKNPLNFVNNFSELSVDLLDELHDAVAPDRLAVADGLRTEIDELTATLKGNLEKIAEHGRRADSIVKNMLLHSRSGPGEHRMVDLNSTVEEALNLAYHGARAATPGFNITMEKRLDPQAGMVDMYPQEITRVLLNLIGNGFYAAHKRAEAAGGNGFEPTLQLTTRDLGDGVEIRVRDNGTGISEAARDRIFEPFFTTKPAGEGTGLGLSLSYEIIVQQHGGRLTVDSEPDAFTEFVVTLPRKLAATNGGQA